MVGQESRVECKQDQISHLSRNIKLDMQVLSSESEVLINLRLQFRKVGEKRIEPGPPEGEVRKMKRKKHRGLGM